MKNARWIAVLLLLTPVFTGEAARASSAPGDAELARARTLLADADTLAAISTLERAHLRSRPTPDAHLLLGSLLRSRGTPEARLRSQLVLEAARARFGDQRDILMELGRTYYAQRFYPDGLTCFNKVLEANPGDCRARFMVGLYHYRNWQRMNEFSDDLAAARRELKAAADCDPDDLRATTLSLYAAWASGDTTVGACDAALARHDDNAALHLLRGVLDYDAGRFVSAEACFRRGLERMPAGDVAAFHTLQPFLPGRQLDQYRRASMDNRATFERGYWIAVDPDPTTEVNERFLEHMRRISIAEIRYAHPLTGRRGWETDRGAIFIRFGEPIGVGYSLGEDWKTGKVETWAYVLHGYFQEFFFVDEFLNGNPRIPYALDLLWNYALNSPRRTLVPETARPVPSAIDVVAFRDDETVASAWVALQIDADSLSRAVNLAREDHLHARIACFDRLWTREWGCSDTLWTLDVPARMAHGRRVLEWVRRVPLPFDRYQIAAALEDGHGRARALARGNVDASRFIQDGLALSDILMCEPDAVDTPAHALIERPGVQLRPRVGRAYGPGERLNVYLEVYDLALEAGSSSWEIRWAIYPARDPEAPAWREWLEWMRDEAPVDLGDDEPLVAQTFHRDGSRRNESERLAIDIDSLTPGRYRLLAEVHDLRAGVRRVVHTPLVKTGQPVAARP